jgi:hypothetical protein
MLRKKLRQLYIEGWYELNIKKLLAATAKDFKFFDPMERAPVDRDGLIRYMERWNARVGYKQEWRLSHETRKDQNGVLTDWEWWELVGTDFAGSAVVTTTDLGVTMEKITYSNIKEFL